VDGIINVVFSAFNWLEVEIIVVVVEGKKVVVDGIINVVFSAFNWLVVEIMVVVVEFSI
jgi:hypothetical protein